MSERKFKPFLSEERWKEFWELVNTFDQFSQMLRDQGDLVFAETLSSLSAKIANFGKDIRSREVHEFNKFHNPNFEASES